MRVFLELQEYSASVFSGAAPLSTGQAIFLAVLSLVDEKESSRFSRGTDSCSLEISCPLGETSGPTWSLGILDITLFRTVLLVQD